MQTDPAKAALPDRFLPSRVNRLQPGVDRYAPRALCGLSFETISMQ